MGSRSRSKNGRAHVTVPGRCYGYDKSKARAARHIRFSDAVATVFAPPSLAGKTEDEVAAIKKARPLCFASRGTLRKRLEAALAKPREAKKPRRRSEKRAELRAIRKALAKRLKLEARK